MSPVLPSPLRPEPVQGGDYRRLEEAARRLDFVTDGLTRVRLEMLDEPAEQGRAGVE
jgi:hypothetical protein